MKLTHYPASATLLALLITTAGHPAAAQSLTRIATMPDGAEVTGLSTNALGDILLNAQHPGGKNTFKDDAPPALLGYIHGFDVDSYAAGSMAIPAEDQRIGVTVAGSPAGSSPAPAVTTSK